MILICLPSFRLKGNVRKWTNQIWFKCVAKALMFEMDSQKLTSQYKE